MIEGGRGSGRTTQQLREGPEEFYFVVHTQAMLSYVRDLAARHAPSKTIRIVTTTSVYPGLQGTNLPILVDHAALSSLSEKTADFIDAHNARFYPTGADRP